MLTILPLDEEATELSTYAYSYPHKSSYRRLSPPVQIADAWQDEDVSGLSLYVHVPFCEMRCGFCNLFTQSQPAGDVVDAYLETLVRQMRIFRAAVPKARFSQFAIGGGTPTFLTARQIEALLRQVETTFGQPICHLPTSVETSPKTSTTDRLKVLADFGVERISIGVQSFLAAETRHLGRPQRTDDVYRALDSIRTFGFPVLNIDLIYGDPRQTRDSWSNSLLQALRWRPEEIYLYPLYIRSETGLARRGACRTRHRDDLYEAGRDLLVGHGYFQSSLRCFRLPRVEVPSTYACQRDGMIGLGCGARSYTQRLHYATRFAVTQSGVRAILEEWIAQSDDELAQATHGVRLSENEQRRRFVIMSLLQAEGLVLADFEQHFPGAAIDNLPGIQILMERGWLTKTDSRYILTASGLQHSDTVGPLLYSQLVRDRLHAFIHSSEFAGGAS